MLWLFENSNSSAVILRPKWSNANFVLIRVLAIFTLDSSNILPKLDSLDYIFVAYSLGLPSTSFIRLTSKLQNLVK